MDTVATTHELMDEITDFLAGSPTLEQIIAFKPSELLDERVHHLLDLNREGQLSSEARKKLEQYIEIDYMMMLKAKACLKLQQSE